MNRCPYTGAQLRFDRQLNEHPGWALFGPYTHNPSSLGDWMVGAFCAGAALGALVTFFLERV
jgi:hypothetical protein